MPESDERCDLISKTVVVRLEEQVSAHQQLFKQVELQVGNLGRQIEGLLREGCRGTEEPQAYGHQRSRQR